MSMLILYKDLKQRISDRVDRVKHIGLFNNQFEMESQENPFLYPCVLIEFRPGAYRDLTHNIQEFDLSVALHIGWESYVDDDLDVLSFKQEIYKSVQGMQSEYYTKLLRRGETPPTNYNNKRDYEMIFETLGKDYDADTRPIRKVLASPVVTGEIIQPNEL